MPTRLDAELIEEGTLSHSFYKLWETGRLHVWSSNQGEHEGPRLRITHMTQLVEGGYLEKLLAALDELLGFVPQGDRFDKLTLEFNELPQGASVRFLLEHPALSPVSRAALVLGVLSTATRLTPELLGVIATEQVPFESVPELPLAAVRAYPWPTFAVTQTYLNGATDDDYRQIVLATSFLVAAAPATTWGEWQLAQQDKLFSLPIVPPTAYSKAVLANFQTYLKYFDESHTKGQLYAALALVGKRHASPLGFQTALVLFPKNLLELLEGEQEEPRASPVRSFEATLEAYLTDSQAKAARRLLSHRDYEHIPFEAGHSELYAGIIHRGGVKRLEEFLNMMVRREVKKNFSPQEGMVLTQRLDAVLTPEWEDYPLDMAFLLV